jgi:two-component system nitrogen regulation sensor histidine kinase NtrY
MGFRGYYLNITIRILLLSATVLVFSFLLNEPELWLVKVNILLLIGLQIYLLGKYHAQFHKDLQMILNSWKSKDFSLFLKSSAKIDEFPDLYATLDEINHQLKESEKKNISETLLFKYIIDHVQVGILAFDADKSIKLINQATMDLFHLKEAPRTLIDLNDQLTKTIAALNIGQSKLMDFNKGGIVKNIVVKTGDFILDASAVTLVTLHDIHSELQKNELQSWQNLISVLAHEIMNSVAPINALSHKLTRYLADEHISPDTLIKARDSAEIVERQSQALMRFVEDYRKISGVPKPNYDSINVLHLLTEIRQLFNADHENIKITVSAKAKLVISADRPQIVQVLLNLCLNSFHAVNDVPNPTIELMAWSDKGRTYISVSDKGKGISDEVMNKIFIPFFTTRINGSGIGLSLSKQIMSLHGGSINVESMVGEGTTVTIIFEKTR